MPAPRRQKRDPLEDWTPRTELGRQVLNGNITNLEEIYQKNVAILEPQIIDKLLPNLEQELLEKTSVQRVTRNGRRISFRVVAAVGNKDGYVGVGMGKGLEMRPTIEKAVRNAKKNIISINRGCGSWECTCGEKHTVPFKVNGSNSSVKIDVMPAPKGTGVVAGDTARKIIELAGIKDAWSKTKGKTTRTLNFAFATLDALKQTRKMKGE